MNIQHSSRTDQWYTPEDVIVRVHQVLGQIDLDPASDAQGNRLIKAARYLTREDDALKTDWALDNSSVFLNPPGGKQGNQSMMALFWKRMMYYKYSGNMSHGIFLAFSAEALQNTQGKGIPALGEHLICVPRKRIRFVDVDGTPGPAPSHSNIIAYVPGTVDRSYMFIEHFQALGTILNRNL